jgi:hypothetical protein
LGSQSAPRPPARSSIALQSRAGGHGQCGLTYTPFSRVSQKRSHHCFLVHFTPLCMDTFPPNIGREKNAGAAAAAAPVASVVAPLAPLSENTHTLLCLSGDSTVTRHRMEGRGPLPHYCNLHPPVYQSINQSIKSINETTQGRPRPSSSNPSTLAFVHKSKGTLSYTHTSAALLLFSRLLIPANDKKEKTRNPAPISPLTPRP